MPSKASRTLISLWRKRNCLVHLQRETRNYATVIPKPYVGAPYAYAFGQGSIPLVYKSLGQALQETVDKMPNNVAVRMEHQHRSVTYREFNEDVNKMAKTLIEDLHLKRGDIIGIWLFNCYEWLVIQQAALRAGIIYCTMSPFYKHLELDYALKKAQVKALFLPSKISPQHCFNDFSSVLEKTEVQEIKKTLKHLVFVEGDAGTGTTLHQDFELHRFEQLLNNDGKIEQSRLDQVLPDDPGTILFTSGTTGKPKATLISHFHMYNNVNTLDLRFRMDPKLPERCVMAIPLPLFHAFACLGTLAVSMCGHEAVFSSYWFNAENLLKSIEKNRCTELWGVPTMLITLSDMAQVSNLDLRSVEIIIGGGAMLNSTILPKIRNGFPSVRDILIGYGATEFGPALTTTVYHDDQDKKENTVGSPLSYVEVKLVDPATKRTVKLGEEGEIWARGFCKMLCYLHDEAKTKEVIDQAGWYNLGDIGVMDNDGYIKIVGRTKEMIIRGGINIFPKEIEGLLHTCPGVVDAYVCGIPDPVLGEEICAWVKMKDTGFDENEKAEEIRKFCKEMLSAYKVPRHFMFVDAFPMTASGKAQKFEMTRISCEKLNIPFNAKK